ncbi:MAG: hypothetical protein NWE85_05615 [Candidatus Bathyarchaeota archaeon]|nr:hypothetical protein [Candidatus Bathyarchaeota archaeon]
MTCVICKATLSQGKNKPLIRGIEGAECVNDALVNIVLSTTSVIVAMSLNDTAKYGKKTYSTSSVDEIWRFSSASLSL